jgi:hypothetical protein
MGNIIPVCIERQRSCGGGIKKDPKKDIVVTFNIKDMYVKKTKTRLKKKKKPTIA